MDGERYTTPNRSVSSERIWTLSHRLISFLIILQWSNIFTKQNWVAIIIRTLQNLHFSLSITQNRWIFLVQVTLGDISAKLLLQLTYSFRLHCGIFVICLFPQRIYTSIPSVRIILDLSACRSPVAYCMLVLIQQKLGVFAHAFGIGWPPIEFTTILLTHLIQVSLICYWTHASPEWAISSAARFKPSWNH